MHEVRRYASLILLILMLMVFTEDQMVLVPNYLLVMEEFKISEVEVGFVSAVFIFVSIFTSLL